MIVTIDQLERYMNGVEFSPAQREAGEDVLASLQAELETYLNRPIEPRIFTTTAIPDPYVGFIRLETPIVSITSVDDNGSALSTGDYDIVPGGINVGVGASPNSITVVYVAGLDAVTTDGMKGTILRAAAREMTTHHDDVVSIKDLSTRASADAGTPSGDDGKTRSGFTDRELARWGRLKRRVAI